MPKLELTRTTEKEEPVKTEATETPPTVDMQTIGYRSLEEYRFYYFAGIPVVALILAVLIPSGSFHPGLWIFVFPALFIPGFVAVWWPLFLKTLWKYRKELPGYPQQKQTGP